MDEAPEGAGAAEAELTYWKARAEALGQELAALRMRLLLLADRLPTRYLPLLTGDLDRLDAEAWSAGALEEIEETVQLTPSDVAPELRRVWKRLAARGSG